MNKETKNKFTLVLSKGIHIIITEYPLRTSMGIILGAIFATVFSLFKPSLSNISFIDINSLKEWNFVAFGLLIIHLPTLYEKLSNKPEFDENIEKAFRVIKKAEEHGVEEEKIQLMYQRLCEKVLDVSIDKERKKETQAIDKGKHFS